MKLDLDPAAHLTYCLNVHPGGTFAEMERAVFEHAPAVFQRVAAATGRSGPWGIGLWLSRVAADDLLDEASRTRFRRRLDAAGLYVATLNGFPFGTFHDQRVKESVYRPDWSEPERARYTRDLVEVFADLLPAGGAGTISTVPVTYAAWSDEPRISRALAALIDTVRHMAEVSDRTGRVVSLALEPEPDCLLETVIGAADFLGDRLLPAGIERLGRAGGLAADEAEHLIRRHVGICLDAVHEAVVGEDPATALSRCREAGWLVPKMQIGAALRFTGRFDEARDVLRPFADEVYLHQTRVVTSAGERSFRDLPDALDALDDSLREIRVHCHVPSSWIGTTLPSGGEALGVVTPSLLSAAIAGGTKVLEVEVYTLDLLPGTVGRVHDVLADDLRWVLDALSTEG